MVPGEIWNSGNKSFYYLTTGPRLSKELSYWLTQKCQEKLLSIIQKKLFVNILTMATADMETSVIFGIQKKTVVKYNVKIKDA